ncbi:tape measure protein [Lactococcus garvieae]|uniref:tape measure protein n=1 Tax=Lactococcus garvieae TaxID=1363 RepID=UPI001F61ED4E|nr:tape measure protein [Lactococcus garvieae]MCI3860067.1 tape measure protein [Lactococcus garvieae]
MAASGVGQFSINVKSNLKDFYGELTKVQKSMKDLTEKRYQLNVDSKQLDQLRDKSQRIAAEMRELRQQKNEIKIGSKQVENAEQEIENINKKLVSLNRQKLEVDAEIQPIRTANTELYKVEQEIDRINNTKVDIKFSESIKNVGNSLNSAGDAILKKFNPLTSKLNQMFGFGLINKGIDSVTGMITGSLDGAINRVDTLNNATNTFKNMKFDDASINKVFGKGGSLSTAIEGLPTTLNDATSNVQLLASTTKDLDLSRDIFKAVNDGALAFGGNADNVNSIITQLTKSFASGKIQGDAFNSMLDGKMGPVLVEIAKRMNITLGELQDGLSKGTISIEDFQKALIDVDVNGSDSLASLESSVKDATKGFKTSMANMRTAVGRGVASMIESFDKVLEDSGLGGFSGVFGKIGKTIENALGTVAKSIEDNQDTILKFFTTVSNAASNAFKVISKIDFGAFFKGLGSGIGALVKDAKLIGKAIGSIFDFISPLFGFLGDNKEEMLGKLIPRILELGIALKVVGTAMKAFGAVSGILGKFKIPKIPGFGKSGKGGDLPLKSVGLEDLKSLGLKMAAVAGLSANVFLAAKALQEVNNIDGDFGELQKKLFSIAETIMIMQGLTVAVNSINKSAGTTALKGFVTIAAIAGEIYLLAKALQEVNNISDDFGGLQSKIFQIALVVTEIGGLAIAVGAIMNTGFGAAALVSGLVAMIGIVGATLLVAKELEALQKISLDQEKITKNLKVINSSLGALGDLAKGNIFAIFDELTGLLKNIVTIGILGEVIIIANELKALEGIELNQKKIQTNIETVNKSLNIIKFDDTVAGSFKKASELFNGILDMGLVAEMIAVAKELELLQNIGINEEAAIKKIKAIQKVLGELDSGGFWSNIGKTFKKSSKVNEIEKSKELIRKLVEVSKELEALQNTNVNDGLVSKKLEAINKALSSITEKLPEAEFSKNIIKNLNQSKEIIQKIVEISREIEALQEINIDKSSDAVTKKITIVNEILTSIQEHSQIIDTSFAETISEGLEKSKGIIQKLAEVARELEPLQNVEINEKKITAAVSSIQQATTAVLDRDFILSINGLPSKLIGNLKEYNEVLGEVIKISNVLKKLEGANLNQENITAEITVIKNAIESISNVASRDIASNLMGMAEALERIVNQLTRNFPPQFNNLGKLLADKMNAGFKEKLNFKKIVDEKLNAVTTDGAKSIGQRIARGINSGFSETLNLGKTVSDSIQEALDKDYSTTVTVHTKTDEGGTSTKKASSNTSKSSKITPAFKLPNTIMASGGRVVTDSVLQDSPEKPHLNNGEYVIPKKIVDALGVPFFDKLRSGSISRTFAGLAQSVSNTTSSVVNNVYNTTNNQSTNVYSSGKRDWKSRANRRFRTV